MDTERLLAETLDAIAAERGNFNRSFSLADELLAAMGEADLAERLYDMIPADHPWRDVADLFAILGWTTSDNGAAMMRAMEGWLRSSNDPRRLEIALSQDAYPFLDRREMEAVVTAAAERVPEVAALCRTRITSRRSLNELSSSPTQS